MKKCYLAGAITCYGELADYPKRWRDEAKKWFSRNIENIMAISPMDYYLPSEHLHKTESEAMRFDLRKVEESDVILVNLERINESVGTIQEIFNAWVHNKAIIGFYESTETLSEDKVSKSFHPWLYEQIDRIETGKYAMHNAMEYIRNYYG